MNSIMFDASRMDGKKKCFINNNNIIITEKCFAFE